MKNKVVILDSTLRDGAQAESINFSIRDKLRIAGTLDELGIPLIEAGNPASNPKDLEFFREAHKLHLKQAKLCAFGSTRRKDTLCSKDKGLRSLLDAETQTAVIFGKAWDFQATEILRTSLKENLAMIRESVAYMCKHGRTVIYDAEHFFDGYKANPAYALQTLSAACEGGASVLVLCDTKGGAMPHEVYDAVQNVCAEFKEFTVGIHAHNDCALAVANSLCAVQAGALHVQGTLLGFGERAGNAELASLIADLELKMNKFCIGKTLLQNLTPLCRKVAEIANIPISSGAPYIGSGAFAHKAGMHVDGVSKNPTAYEHVDPSKVGNKRSFLVSEVAGRSTVIEKIHAFNPAIKKDSSVVLKIIKKVKELEHEGYQFEGADGSFELLVRKITGSYKPFFTLRYYKTVGEQPRVDKDLCSFVQIKIEVDGQIEVTAGEGDGPVHALDTALRKALERFYPCVNTMRLIDDKVRVLDSKSAAAAKVRVLIESASGSEVWTTVGVSSDIVEASWLALVDSFEYKLIRDAAALELQKNKI